MTLDDETGARIRDLRREVRLECGGHEDFRHAGGQCGMVAEEIALAFGWRELYGLYRLASGRMCPHAWNTLPDGSVLDATADQFGEGHDVRLVAAGDPGQERYVGTFVVYRDAAGQLYFFDHDGDLLYLDLDGDGLPPDEVRQLPGDYCPDGGRGPVSDDFYEDLPAATRLDEDWDSVVARSHGL